MPTDLKHVMYSPLNLIDRGSKENSASQKKACVYPQEDAARFYKILGWLGMLQKM